MPPRRLNKPIHYERHAEQRLKQRGIDKCDVEKAITDPLTRTAAKRPGAKRITYQLNRAETLVVIIEEAANVIMVVSVRVQNAE